MKIKRITHQYPYEVLQSRIDEAHVTGQPLVERPHHYQNLENGQLYYDLYGCIGFPSEVKDNDPGMPGYCAVVGVIKPKAEGEKIQDAKFQLLAEYESRDVPSLIDAVLALRSEWGHGLHPELLVAWFGDPEQHVATLALKNERIKKPLLVTPTYDLYDPCVFDIYVRSIQSVIMPGRVRLYFGGLSLLKSKLSEFKRNNPAVIAAGGMIHTLIMQCEWSDNQRSNAFNLEGEGEVV
uniref:Uncharacterized protein n=1 Tax=viral metagenome TaxID=1070528 RepID=A0A6H1ZUD5_9ZZZZ